jgi:putative transposase
MARKVPFAVGEIYHIYNRGVEKRDIFLDDGDYRRFIYILSHFNTKKSNQHTHRHTGRGPTSTSMNVDHEREPLVEILNWCLMPNHYHLCVQELVPGGIVKFLQKTMTGYTMYFNTKYQRSGVLFQGKTKSRHVDSDAYLRYLQYYIDYNPLDLFMPKWKENGISDKQKALEFLREYRWHKKGDYEHYVDSIGGADFLGKDDVAFEDIDDWVTR